MTQKGSFWPKWPKRAILGQNGPYPANMAQIWPKMAQNPNKTPNWLERPPKGPKRVIWGQTPDLAENHCFWSFWPLLGHFGHIRPKGPFWAILGQYGSNMAQNGLKWPIWLIWASKGRKPGFRAPDPKMAENHCFGQNDHFWVILAISGQKALLGL